MPEPFIHILCTRPVDDAMVKAARKRNVLIDGLPFIETTPVRDIETQQEIEAASIEETAVVFTSMNAVDAVTQLLDGYIPAWRIYCIGHKTRQLVKNYFGAASIAGAADNASLLADRILVDGDTEELIFFCGDQRRDELPAKLRAAQIHVTEIVVYETTVIEHKIEKEYQGVIFFSPTAAACFFSTNRLSPSAIVFAIGQTTAGEIGKYCSNRILMGDKADKEALLDAAVDFFTNR